MNIISELPEMTGQKVTILKQTDMGYYYSAHIVIIKQGSSFYCGHSNTPFFCYSIGKKKAVYQISIIPETVIAIYPGHIDIDTDPHIDNHDNSMIDLGFGFDITHFETAMKSTNVTPLFVYYKKDD